MGTLERIRFVACDCLRGADFPLVVQFMGVGELIDGVGELLGGEVSAAGPPSAAR